MAAIILFDCGSTHNFISLELAAKLGIQHFEMGDAMKVDGAFIGQDVSVTPFIEKIRLHIQGYVDKEDFFISPLKHEDVILGAPWFGRLAAFIKFLERKISFKFREIDMYIVAQESGSSIPLVNDEAFEKSIKSSISAVDLSGTLEYLKKLEREKHTAEQRAVQLAREKIKEALSRKAEEPVLEPTQGSPKRPRQEEEEEIEDIQANPIPPSPINIPLAPPSSPITPFPPASSPQTPPSPLPLETPLSPPAPTSPQQQHLSAEPLDIPAPTTQETPQPMETQTSPQKETAKPLDKVDEEKQTEGEQNQPTKVDVPILMIQEEEPSSQEAILEVRSFDYTKLIQTLSRQFQCQQVVAKETEIQKTRANQAHEEIANLTTALELVTKEKDSSARENKNLIRDLMYLQSQLTKKEAQNHELIKNEKKMKEQINYEDARFQKLNTSYNTVKNTLTALLQNQEPATTAPSTSDSAALNTLAALQAKLQTEKL
ncbi:hypothetical protein L7F22_046034 [Adiantum nelumboides]|nr:hypothetical protein [Adiantum nelumboides]